MGGYATHEAATFERVIAARNRAVSTRGDVSEQSPAQQAVVDGLRQLLALSEAAILTLMIGLALSIPVYMAIWFAPSLVALNDFEPVQALKTSFGACLKNIVPYLLYGVILCNARAMGEFGAVSVVSGHVRGLTNTLPLHVEILYNEYQFSAAFAVASLLALLALVTLVLKQVVEWRAGHAAQKEE